MLERSGPTGPASGPPCHDLHFRPSSVELLSLGAPTSSARKSSHVRRPTAGFEERRAPSRTARAAAPGRGSARIGRCLRAACRYARTISARSYARRPGHVGCPASRRAERRLQKHDVQDQAQQEQEPGVHGAATPPTRPPASLGHRRWRRVARPEARGRRSPLGRPRRDRSSATGDATLACQWRCLYSAPGRRWRATKPGASDRRLRLSFERMLLT